MVISPLSGPPIVENDSTIEPAQFNIVRSCLLSVKGYPLVSYTLSAKQIFQHPGLIIMAIAGTRMHRSLVDFATKTTDM